jgi:Cys-rich four helix bundle protein (predicted Tat secretion target)
MDRREMLGTVGTMGTLALAGLATQAFAANNHAHHNHGKASKYQPLIAAAGDCMVKGEACLAHCLVLLGEGEKALAECAREVNQTLAICAALQKLAAQGAKATGAVAKVAINICVDCEKACKKHADKHAECKACMDACTECIKQCKAFAA